MYDEKEDFRTHKAEVDALISMLDRLGVPLRADMTILDVGGGQGMHVAFLMARVRQVFCADVVDYSSLYSGEFLKLLDEKHRRNAVAFDLARAAFHRTDAMNLIYRDDLFDAVVSINAFEHIPDPRRALNEMIRVTRPGGSIYVSTDPIWTADTGSHFFHRVPEPWAHLLSDDVTFTRRMRESDASDDEAEEYRRAMNRWRLRDYLTLVREVEAAGRAGVIHHDSWSGVVDDAHARHPNVAALEASGYSRSELMVRGLRWVFRKR